MLTHARLLEVLSYNKRTGVFIRRIKSAPCVTIGERAGNVDARGYRVVGVDGKQYPEHRLAWFYVKGYWPTGQIDHLNGVRDDNRFRNLRDATVQINRQNRRTPNSNNKVGLLGVVLFKPTGRYMAGISHPETRKRIHLGYFSTPEEAHAAYIAAKRKYHEGNTL